MQIVSKSVTNMVFFNSRWRKGEVLKQEDKHNILTKFKAENLSARFGKRLQLCGAVSLMIASVLLLVFISSALKVEVFQPQLPATVRFIDKAINIQAEKEAPGLLQKTSWRSQMFIEDVVILPEEILVLVRSSTNFKLNKEEMRCIFSNQTMTKVLGVDDVGKRIAVRCEIPSQGLPQLLHNGVSLLHSHSSRSFISIEAQNSLSFVKWDHRLVYEALVLPSEVILFAKGFGAKQAEEINVEDWWCSFDGHVQTRVTVAAQEVFRCQNPPSSLQANIQGKKVTLKRSNGALIPSIAYYEADVANPKLVDDDHELLNISSFDNIHGINISTNLPTHKHFLCACTMIFNGAKFLREWITYHSFLGVEHFFVYDNNSEDDLQNEVQRLTAADFNVSRHPWPWIKSQEAGFSHCSLRAQTQCTWMMYTDVDEFVFPKAWLHHSNVKIHHPQRLGNRSKHLAEEIPILKALILRTTAERKSSARKKIGQISLRCRDFGPSGLTKNPPQGLMQGYTCRIRNEQRHKSIVQPNAIATSLINVVHHFKLQPQYESVQLSAGKAVINHYKYQAWEEFKKKFRRRVSAYVTDWTVDRNIHSKDRTPGLGRKAVKPAGWEHKFCEVHDTALRDYAHHLANSSLLLLS